AARMADQFERVEAGIMSFLHDHPRRLGEVLAIETIAQALLVIEVWILIVALGFARSWIQPLVIEGGVKFVGVVFAFIPGQFGASEGTYSLIAGAVGLPPAVGLTVALVRRFRGVFVAVAGLIAVTLWSDH